MVCVSVRISGVIHFWTARVIKEKSTVINPMQTAALWFPFICYRCLSESMSSPAPHLAACLYPYPASRLPFLPGRSLHLLSQRQNQRCSHIVKDWLYGLFCLYKQFSDPCQKKSEFAITEEGQGGRLRRDAKRSVLGMWVQQMLLQLVRLCCIVFISTVAEINIHINSLN